MSNKPSSIIINNAKINRIDPENVLLEASGIILDEKDNSIPQLKVSLLINSINVNSIVSDDNGILNINETLELHEGEQVSVQLQEIISKIKSNAQIIIDKGEKNKKIRLNKESIDDEGKEWIKNKLKFYKNEITKLSEDNSIIKNIDKINILVNEFDEFSFRYFNLFSWTEQQFCEFEYPKIKKIIENKINDLLEKEKLEKERLEKETKERLEKDRLEKDRLEKERLENERLEKEKLENERLEKEKLENERLEKEKLENERLEKEKLENERLEKEKLENERLEKEKLENERLEKEKLENERLEKEKLENERLEKEKLENERLEKKKLSKFLNILETFLEYNGKKIIGIPGIGHIESLDNFDIIFEKYLLSLGNPKDFINFNKKIINAKIFHNLIAVKRDIFNSPENINIIIIEILIKYGLDINLKYRDIFNHELIISVNPSVTNFNGTLLDIFELRKNFLKIQINSLNLCNDKNKEELDIISELIKLFKKYKAKKIINV